MTPEALMQLAIAQGRAAIGAGQTPIGCAIAIGDQVIAANHNRVLATTDITAHAEIVALREACQTTGEIHLAGALVASTCEPCPMCMAALHWARVDSVVYGATIADAKAAGFNELRIPAAEIIRLGGSSVKLQSDVLRDECAALFDEWRESGKVRAY
ncbi:MAG: nucleoside deaminase [Pirellulales bacterium]